MNIRLMIFLALALTFLSGFVAAQPKGQNKKSGPRTFNIIASESSLTVFVAKDGILARMAHDHNIAVRSLSGRVVIPATGANAGTLELEVDARSLAITDKISDKDKNEITNNMNTYVLESSKFPKITFRSTSITNFNQIGTNASFTLNGDLTLHGTTRRIAIPLQVALAGDTLRATGHYTLRQTDFGIKPYSAMMGTIKVKNEVVIRFNMVAK